VPGCRRRSLATRHRVDQIVHADDFQVDVAPCCMNQVIPANRRQIAISGVDHNVQLGISELQSGGERNRAAMRRVKRV
jgi:hypothetical protein